MLPSMPVLFPRESQSAEGFPFTPAPLAFQFTEPAQKAQEKPVPEKVIETPIEKNAEQPSETNLSEEELQEINLVSAYYNKVRNKLGVEKFIKFRDLLADFPAGQESPAHLYRRLESVLDGELLEEFLLFLTPGQAKEVDRFMDHLMITRVTKFIRYLQGALARKPAKLRKVIRAVCSSTPADICHKVEPLLRTDRRLLQRFRALFPDFRPPDSLYTPETIEEFPESAWATDAGEHRMELDERAEDKRAADVTYLHGRVFIRQGKVLRPATLTFPGSSLDKHIKRLAPPPDPNHNPPANKDEKRDAKDHKSKKATEKSKKDKKDTKTSDKKGTLKVGVDDKNKKSQDVSKSNCTETSKQRTDRGKRKLDDVKEDKQKSKSKRLNAKKTDADSDKTKKKTVFDKGKRKSKEKSTVKRDKRKQPNCKQNVKEPTKCDWTKEEGKTLESQTIDQRNRIKKNADCKQNIKEPPKNADWTKEEGEMQESQIEESNRTDTMEMKGACDWTREEDKTILVVLKTGSDSEETLARMKELLPHRSLQELENRFHYVLDLLRKMALGQVT